MKITRHFRERWIERVGSPLPSEEELEKMIAGAIWLQKGQEYFTARGWRRKILSLYWLPEHNCILKIDKKEKRAITVITSNIMEK